MKGLTIKYMNLEVGQITDATITGIKKYGIFLNINNNIAFCHISNISGKFINDINRYHLALSINKNPEFIVETTEELFNKYPFLQELGETLCK